jgi:hypothetical protein
MPRLAAVLRSDNAEDRTHPSDSGRIAGFRTKTSEDGRPAGRFLSLGTVVLLASPPSLEQRRDAQELLHFPG